MIESEVNFPIDWICGVEGELASNLEDDSDKGKSHLAATLPHNLNLTDSLGFLRKCRMKRFCSGINRQG